MMARPFFPYPWRTWLRNRRYLGKHATRPHSRNFYSGFGDIYPRRMLFAPVHNLNRLFVSGYDKGSYYDHTKTNRGENYYGYTRK